MREFKFRAWDKIHKDIKEVAVISWVSKFTALWNRVGNIRMTIDRDFDDIVLMQYTGLKDKNGKEIYEGDIVTAWSQGSHGTFQIKWREDGGGSPLWLLYPAWQNGEMWGIAASREQDGQVYDRGLEIIGNIYENPESVKTT